MCTGCTKCTCTSKAQWSCDDVKLCEDIEMDEDKFMDQDEIFDNALDILDRGKEKVYYLAHSETLTTNESIYTLGIILM